MRPDTVRFDGRIVFLTRDPELLRRQLQGEQLTYSDDLELLDNISTDEITPGWVCFYYDETLARYVYAGLRDGDIGKDALINAKAAVLVSGLSKGCGSSRETAPYAEKWAGVQLIVARNIEKIYGQNCQNIGLLTSTDFALLDRIAKGESIELAEFTRGLDDIGADIVRHGGLFPYNKARLSGEVAPPPVRTGARPMNLAEKIIASKAVVDASVGRLGLPGVKPGDSLFCRTDVRFTHEYVTPMASALFARFLGEDARVTDPETVYAFRDHLTFLGEVMSDKHREMGLLEQADGLAETQARFTKAQGIRLYSEVAEGGSEAICHNAVLEDLADPGDLIVGSDSHTCTAGALGAFAFGVGATDIANAWYTKDIRVVVPQVVRVELKGIMPEHVSAKDVMLRILAAPYIRAGKAIGQVLEFAGEGVEAMNMDERATLTNMAVEGAATTGIIAADEVTVAYLKENGRWDPARDGKPFLCSDPDAEYIHRFEIDLAELRPMVATPGDPRNGIFLDQLEVTTGGPVVIDIAYGGSCTGGKMTDMDMYARVLKKALDQGLRVADGVRLYIQFGSQLIKQYAEKQGYLEIFKAAGAELINPSCGACIRAGPGVSSTAEQITVSAINRNFPGRSGPGNVYLASPLVVAASAVAGYIVEPARMHLPKGSARVAS
ncbi:MAG: 3-isopropylmalate/(R)-2-methylmalate dehydratase large subunit [Myxococcota bacterium]|jgi:3-isopropylmalate/(R)-2-methylmalate dehydratase large subunit